MRRRPWATGRLWESEIVERETEIKKGGNRMAKFKADRRLKVCSVSNGDYRKQKPTIRLRGDWIGDLGFRIGEPIIVHCEGGKLTITLANEVIDDGVAVM